ncbi:pimeloyl-ACP methyl ester carboxylesterase [Streptomyces canus]|nr:pimeloyl-ACP methyl ester carboxylesterase [Streptomyces canus]
MEWRGRRPQPAELGKWRVRRSAHRAGREGLSIDRVYLQSELSGELEGRKALEATRVRVVTAPGAGHNVMLDNPYAFVAAVAGTK